MKVSNGLHFTKILVTIATKWRHAPFDIRPNNLPLVIISEKRPQLPQRWQNCKKIYKSVFEKITSEFSRGSKYNKNKVDLNVIANYVHKTWLNGILVLNESSNIWLPRVKISEKSPHLTFRNIGMNINWYRPLFCFLSKIAPKILKFGGK